MEKICFKEILEIFLTKTIHDLKSEYDVPKMNFIFKEDTIFKDIIDNPYNKNSWLPNAKKEDLDLLNRQDDDAITIKVEDTYLFFELLQKITNASVELDASYGTPSHPRTTAINIMKYIWLRMGIEDVNNIERFLEKQLEFYNNSTLDSSNIKVDNFYDYKVEMYTKKNNAFGESTRSMIFTIVNDYKDKQYELPRILYDIDEDNNCYIYGIQNNINIEKDKTIERKLYKINKNIDNPNVHPSKVYSLLFFINELNKNNISKIIVPSMQILDYDYHIILGEKAKKELERIEKFLEQNPNDFDYLIKYNNAKNWYNRVYNKQDKISYLKTEELLNLMYRITLHDSSIEITNEINIQGDSLNIKIKK